MAKGKTILFMPMTSSSISHVVRSLATADELSKQGHQIYFTSCSNKKKFIEDHGYKVVETYPPVNINDPNDQSHNFLLDHQDLFVKWFQSEINAVNKIKPDICVRAPAIFGPVTYYATGVPEISIMDIQYLGDDSKGLMGLSLSNNSLSHKLVRSTLRPIFDKKFTEIYLKELLKIYKKLGIKSDFENRKQLYEPMGNLIPADDITEPVRTKSPKIKHVGPIFWNGFDEMDTDLTEDFIRDFKGTKPLVYLMFGASIFNEKIYERILTPLLNSNYKTIICIGPNFERSKFQPDSDRVIIRNLVPGMRLSRLSTIMVNTGAQGSMMQGLWWGKPQVAIPTIMDQAYYANRLEELNLGINANPIPITKFSKREAFNELSEEVPERILNGINTLLKNNKYHRTAVEFSHYLHKNYSDSSKVAANLILKYAQKKCL